MYQSIPKYRLDAVRAEFERNGLAVADWARANGFSPPLVYQILAGRKRCRRGKSHEIAIRLGLKAGRIGSLDDLNTAQDDGTSP